MTVTLIYAYWPNRPLGVTWCDLPWALREAGLAERLHQSGHEVIEMTLHQDGDDAEDLIGGFKLARDVGGAIDIAREKGELPVVLCGSCAVAAMGAAASALGGPETAVLWCDAHPDLNTPEATRSGLLEGMALSVATGRSWQALAQDVAGVTPFALERAVLFGARDVDPGEVQVIETAGVSVTSAVDAAQAALSPSVPTYVHLDMDVHDALQVRANAFAFADGPSVDAVRDLLTGLETLEVLAVTGLDPAADPDKKAAGVAVDHVCAIVDAWRERNNDT